MVASLTTLDQFTTKFAEAQAASAAFGQPAAAREASKEKYGTHSSYTYYAPLARLGKGMILPGTADCLKGLRVVLSGTCTFMNDADIWKHVEQLGGIRKENVCGRPDVATDLVIVGLRATEFPDAWTQGTATEEEVAQWKMQKGEEGTMRTGVKYKKATSNNEKLRAQQSTHGESCTQHNAERSPSHHGESHHCNACAVRSDSHCR